MFHVHARELPGSDRYIFFHHNMSLILTQSVSDAYELFGHARRRYEIKDHPHCLFRYIDTTQVTEFFVPAKSYHVSYMLLRLDARGFHLLSNQYKTEWDD